MLIEKFAAKKPTCVQYDEKLQFYSNLVKEVIYVTLDAVLHLKNHFLYHLFD